MDFQIKDQNYEEIANESIESKSIKVPRMKGKNNNNHSSFNSFQNNSTIKKDNFQISQVIVNYPKESNEISSSIKEFNNSVKHSHENSINNEEIKLKISENINHVKTNEELTILLNKIKSEYTLQKLIFDKNIGEIIKIIEG
jgi:hypothetical protein